MKTVYGWSVIAACSLALAVFMAVLIATALRT